jgi:dihydrofolate reductase
MPRLSVFIACSLDGYIATTEGSLDWLEQATLPGEDYGYDAFLATVDCVAMGRGTYDHIAGIDPLPFGERPVFVFTHRAPPAREGVTFWRAAPREAVARWNQMGLERVYVDGGALISSFLAEGLIDDLTITVAPVLLGAGRPLFHAGVPAAILESTAVKSWASGLVRLSYVRSGRGG